MSMKYITSVTEMSGDIQHVVEVSGTNHFVVQKPTTEPYGEEQGKTLFSYGGFTISESFNAKYRTDKYFHLAQIVFAIEIVRFVIKSTGGRK